MFISVPVVGNQNWIGEFQLTDSKSIIEKVTYQNIKRHPFYNPVFGGLSWYGNGRGCNESNGWITVDSVKYGGKVLKAIDLRFNQNCNHRFGILKGKLHWNQ